MYEVFYSLRAEPFRLSPDHRFCYEHSGYAKARAYMAYALKRAEGFVMITGRPGTGKTTLIGELVESLADEDVITANLVCTQLQADDLLRTVAYSFEVGSTNVDKAELLQRITVMLNRWHREGRRALLVVDEAQDLSISAMEELRLLTNIQVGGQPLLQIFLLGQPELRDLILSPELEQVHQRIVAASHLEGLQEEEAEAYVIHRMQVVGWQGDPAIDRRIFPLIHKFSEGIPRRINLICSRLLLLGCVEERHEIGPDDVRVVIQELQAESLAAGSWHSEQEFTDAGEPDWVVVPGSKPEAVEDSSEPVHLRAVAGEAFTPPDSGKQQEGAAKKKDPVPVATTDPGPESEVSPAAPLVAAAQNEPASDSLEPPPVDGLANEAQGSIDTPKVSPEDESTAEFAGIQRSPNIPELDESSTQSSYDDQQYQAGTSGSATALGETSATTEGREDGDVAPMPARVAGSREGQRVAVPSRRSSSFFIVVAIVLALGVSLLFFLELYMGRDGGWSDNQIVSPVAPEQGSAGSKEVEESLEPEPSLAELAQLPSEKWEEEGQLIFMDEEEEAAGAEDLRAAGSSDAATAQEIPENEVGAQTEEAVMLESDFIPAAAPFLADRDLLDMDTAEQLDGAGQTEVREKDGAALLSVLGVAAAETSYSVSFEFDSIFLDAEARAILAAVVERMRQEPGYRAVLTGFADYKGAEAYNLVLSRQRAEEVMQFLVAAGLSAQRLSVDGRGAQPQPESGDKESLQQLRVVEIDLIEETTSR